MRVGKILPTFPEAAEYAKRVDSYVQNLHRDIRIALAYSDPGGLELQAKGLRAIGYEALASELEGDAGRIRIRIATIPPEQAAKEAAFGSAWLSFLHRWNAFFADGETWYGTAGSYWDAIEVYETEFLKYRAQFRAMGGTPSGPEPVTPKEVDDAHEGAPLLSFSVPWGSILIGAAALGAGYWFLTRKSSGGGGGGLPALPPAVPGTERHAAEHNK